MNTDDEEYGEEQRKQPGVRGPPTTHWLDSTKSVNTPQL